jgi:hypothetical protein
LTELMTARPPSRTSAASITSASVESITSGRVDWVAYRSTTSIMSGTPSRPT